jgi:penicillin-insensitive murein DD-endopeptidase
MPQQLLQTLARAWRPNLLAAVLCICALSAQKAAAQDLGTLDPEPPPPLAHAGPTTPAKQLFGRETVPADLATRTIGFYSRGCLAGGVALPVNGPDWQVMLISRNRYWGNPVLIAFLERFAKKVPQVSHWPGILVGDMSQPRGGPMLTGHASHQIGLDVDIWLKPMPPRRLSRAERERMLSTNVVRADGLDVDPRVWSLDDVAVIKAAAQDSMVQRIFVNAAIKKALCRNARGDRSWLTKVRPFWGHDYHFHVRLLCPRGETACEGQAPVTQGEGCGPSDLAYWFSPGVLHPRPRSWKPRPALTLADLPAPCRAVLTAK